MQETAGTAPADEGVVAAAVSEAVLRPACSSTPPAEVTCAPLNDDAQDSAEVNATFGSSVLTNANGLVSPQGITKLELQAKKASGMLPSNLGLLSH